MKIKKSISILLTAFLFFGYVPIAYGCKKADEELSLLLTKKEERAQLYLNEEYDASTLIVAEQDVEYSIGELFYLDKNFEKQTIKHEGMKFTQTVFSDVIVELIAKKGSSQDSALVELPIDYANPVGDEENIFEHLIATGFSQTKNIDKDYVKDGQMSVKLRYISAVRPSVNKAYLIQNGGYVLYALFAEQENVYSTFSAYDETRNTYKSATGEKTYAGFWVKNTTGKKLTLGLNLKIYGKGLTDSVNYGNEYLSYPNYPMEEGDIQSPVLVLAAEDVEWHYYEMELSVLPDEFPEQADHFRMGVCVLLENAAIGDVFYIDGFDIYHGSKLS